MPDEKNAHNVFISWSGPRSQHVADALRKWLPMVLQAAVPFMSKRDIDKGSRWHLELAKALESMKVGIVCLTPENLSEPWLLFEAGALSKTVDTGTRVCTYLIAGLQPQEVPPPLSEFQATKAEQDDTRQLLQNINVSLGSPVAEATLNEVFDLAWPKLEKHLTSLPKPDKSVPPKRETADMVGELLEIVRAEGNKQMQGLEVLSAQVSHVERVLSHAPFAALADLGFAWLTPGTTIVGRSSGTAIPNVTVVANQASGATEPVGPVRGEDKKEGQR